MYVYGAHTHITHCLIQRKSSDMFVSVYFVVSISCTNTPNPPFDIKKEFRDAIIYTCIHTAYTDTQNTPFDVEKVFQYVYSYIVHIHE